jgi:hypothetical protein
MVPALVLTVRLLSPAARGDSQAVAFGSQIIGNQLLGINRTEVM